MHFGATLQDKLEKIAGPVVDSAGCELVDILAVVEHGQNILRVFIDKPGGVTIDDCAAVSRELGALLDVEDVVPGRYSLEVSSPGLDRVLKREKDFERFRGRRIKIRTLRPIGGRSNFKVTLEGVREGIITVRDDSGELWQININDIRRANLVPEI